MDSDFYIFLRLYIFCISMYLSFLKYKDNKLDIAFLFLVVGIAFNPFFSLRFSDDFQNVIEFFTAGFFGYFSYKEYKKLKNGLKIQVRKNEDSNNDLDFLMFADAYREAANILEEKLEEKHTELVIPFVYLLRHSLELDLKRIIFTFKLCESKIKGHDIKKIFYQFQSSLVTFPKDGDIWKMVCKDRHVESVDDFESFVQRIDNNLNEFCKIISQVMIDGEFIWDIDNQDYRYPSGNYYEPVHIVIKNLFVNRERISYLSAKVSVDLDIVNDFLLRMVTK